jgi:hypothetical protein
VGSLLLSASKHSGLCFEGAASNAIFHCITSNIIQAVSKNIDLPILFEYLDAQNYHFPPN